MSEVEHWSKGGVTAEYRPSDGTLRIYQPLSGRVLGPEFTRELAEWLNVHVFGWTPHTPDDGAADYLAAVASSEPPVEEPPVPDPAEDSEPVQGRSRTSTTPSSRAPRKRAPRKAS